MDSQNASSAREARAPQRRRGERRVAALLEASAAIFSEKGFQAATMTEIASRAATAVGSLYQFFPSKQSLAVALLDQYRDRLFGMLDALAARTDLRDADALADALVGLTLETRGERALALRLLDESGIGSGCRDDLRGGLRLRLAALLRARRPETDPAVLDGTALLLMGQMKVAGWLAEEPDAAIREAAIAQLARMLRAYLHVSS